MTRYFHQCVRSCSTLSTGRVTKEQISTRIKNALSFSKTSTERDDAAKAPLRETPPRTLHLAGLSLHKKKNQFSTILFRTHVSDQIAIAIVRLSKSI